MEAKDTVIQAMINPDVANTHVLRYDAVELIKQAQAENSLKAGIKEVVEWIERHSHPMNTNMYGISLGRDEWQAKLKEWGIE